MLVSPQFNSLTVCEALRLLLTCSYCKALCVFQNKHQTAKVIAEKSFFLATDSHNELAEEAAKVLQILRDSFMTYQKEKPVEKERIEMPKLVPGKIMTLEESEYLQREKIPAEPSETELPPEEVKDLEASFFGKRKSSKVKEIQTIKSQRHLRFMDDDDHLAAINPELVGNKKYRLALHIRRHILLPVPIMLEGLPSSSLILKALDRIFRAYVRGNALPGQQSGGNTVDLAGNTLSFRAFVLQGPYMSWKGFLSFLLDFSIASLPEPSSKSGKNFYRSLNPAMAKDLLQRQENAANPEPSKNSGQFSPESVLTMQESAMVFIESARSATPALVISKFMQLYAELAETLEQDPWRNVLDWTTQDERLNEWNIVFGINFMQFVDCLGKLGIVAYSEQLFHEMLPTNNDKIEHFFSAFLGLTDERKWLKRVDNKLKKAKMIIKELARQDSPPNRKGTAIDKKEKEREEKKRDRVG